MFESGDTTSLDEVLINTDETDQVTSWDIINGFDVTAHHKNGTLDLFVVKIGLFAWDVVWTHNSDLLTSGDFTSEDTTESIESTLVRCWDHLGDVSHQWTVSIAVLESNSDGIVLWTFIQHFHTVVLGGQWRWQMNGNHLEKSFTSWEPGSHETFEEWFGLEVLVITLEDNTADLHDLGNIVFFLFHDGFEGLVDWIQNPLDETTFWGSGGHSLDPLLVLGIVEVITPQVLHHFVQINLEFSGIHFSELFEGESPSVETGTETDSTVFWGDVEGSHWTIFISTTIGSNDDIDVLNNTRESLVKFFGVQLQFEKSTVHLVHEKNWLYTFGNSLTKDGFGLDTDTGDTVNDDEGTISDTESSSDLE